MDEEGGQGLDANTNKTSCDEAAVCAAVACSFRVKLVVVVVCETERSRKKKSMSTHAAVRLQKKIDEGGKKTTECDTPALHLNCKLNWMQISS